MSAVEREIRARFDDKTIRVYQAYADPIADVALANQTFAAPFSRGRMTWIKPSFTWMMYRAGWATKVGQTRVLAIDITRSGFEWALAHSVLSHFDPAIHASAEAWREAMTSAPVRIQWDPERSITLEALPWRAIQIGLSGAAVAGYVDEWIVRIEEVTPLARRIAQLDPDAATAQRPVEAPYPLSAELAERIGASR